MAQKTLRPSPSAHAADCPDEERKGNDGLPYRSVADKNGVYHWKKVTTDAKVGAVSAKATDKAPPKAVSASGGRPSAAASPPRGGRGGLDAAAQEQQARARLGARIAKQGLEALEEPIMAAALPCLVGAYREAPKGKIPVGTSRLGGLPDVPAGFVWPTTTRGKVPNPRSTRKVRSFPLTFIGQINCADSAPLDRAGSLPPSGLLSFFFDLGSTDHGVVFFTPADAPLSQAPSPPDLEESTLQPPVLIQKLRADLSVPDWQDHARAAMFKGAKKILRLQRLEGRAESTEVDLSDEEDIDRQYQDVSMDGHKDGDRLQILGNAVYVQSSSTSKGDQLLLQLSQPSTWPTYVFGDTGTLYFWVKKSDLSKGQFKKAWAYTQCS